MNLDAAIENGRGTNISSAWLEAARRHVLAKVRECARCRGIARGSVSWPAEY
jgi:hypothetical protein